MTSSCFGTPRYPEQGAHALPSDSTVWSFLPMLSTGWSLPSCWEIPPASSSFSGFRIQHPSMLSDLSYRTPALLCFPLLYYFLNIFARITLISVSLDIAMYIAVTIELPFHISLSIGHIYTYISESAAMHTLTCPHVWCTIYADVCQRAVLLSQKVNKVMHETLQHWVIEHLMQNISQRVCHGCSQNINNILRKHVLTCCWFCGKILTKQEVRKSIDRYARAVFCRWICIAYGVVFFIAYRARLVTCHLCAIFRFWSIIVAQKGIY